MIDEIVQCSNPTECYCKGRRWCCPRCKRFVPECFGAADDLFHLCDDCYVAVKEEEEERDAKKDSDT